MINAIPAAAIPPQQSPAPQSTGIPEEPNVNNFSGILQASFQITATLDSFPQTCPGTNHTDNMDSNTSYLVTSEDVNNSLKQNYQKFTDLVDNALTDAEIEKYPDFEILADRNGRLHINSEREDKNYIEHILNKSPGIKQIFLEMSRDTAQAAAMERMHDFCKHYSANPQSGIQSYQTEDTESPDDTLSIQVSDRGYIPRLYSHGSESQLQAFEDIKAGDFSDHRYKRTLQLETVALYR